MGYGNIAGEWVGQAYQAGETIGPDGRLQQSATTGRPEAVR